MQQMVEMQCTDQLFAIFSDIVHDRASRSNPHQNLTEVNPLLNFENHPPTFVVNGKFPLRRNRSAETLLIANSI